MSERVFITGYGMITSIGKNSEENYQSLLKKKCGYGKIEVLDTLHHDDLPACEIKLTDQQLCELANVPSGKGFTRPALLGVIAFREAIHKAELTSQDVSESGLLSATTTGGIREFEKYYYHLQDPTKQGDFNVFANTTNPGEHTERMAELFGIKKYVGTISTACSSSANSILLGAQLIRNHELDCVICGGTEALSKFTINGFNSLMILDSEHCRPFDNSRRGLNLGEGAAYFVLESERSIQRRNKSPVAELKGYGNANDAFHLTASSQDGVGAYQAMSLALRSGNISPSEVSYINAHGTATENNDLSEGLAIQRLFGEDVPYFSSTKPYTGHTLAAAGSIEGAFCMMALQHRVIFPNINFSHQMNELTITPEKELLQHIPLKTVLSNSFGFGGNATSLLFGAV